MSDRFDKKKIRKSLFILLLIAIIIIAIILIRRTLARYETSATSEKDVAVAFWIIDESYKTDTMLIKDIFPSNLSFDYKFYVSNFEMQRDADGKLLFDENGKPISGTKKAETDLEYELVLTTTTNLPLEYQIEKNGTLCATTETIYTDDDGTFYREIKLVTEKNSMTQGTDITDNFVLKVTFPKDNNTNAEFSDLIEYIKLDLNAKQVIT